MMDRLAAAGTMTVALALGVPAAARERGSTADAIVAACVEARRPSMCPAGGCVDECIDELRRRAETDALHAEEVCEARQVADHARHPAKACGIATGSLPTGEQREAATNALASSDAATVDARVASVFALEARAREASCVATCNRVARETVETNERVFSERTPPQHRGKTVSLLLTNSLGLTATTTAAVGGDATESLGSLSVSSRRAGYAYDRGLDVRVVNAIDLGAGDHHGTVAFHGGIAIEAAGGYRFRATETQGPFVRAGIEALVGGDSLLYQSLLELPQVQLGYQYLAGVSLLEIAARSGFAILGRSNTGEHASRTLDQGIDVGAMATAKVGPMLAAGEWSHFVARGDGAPVDWLAVSLCGIARPVAVCTEVRAVVEDVTLPSSVATSSRVTEVGLTVGTGRY